VWILGRRVNIFLDVLYWFDKNEKMKEENYVHKAMTRYMKFLALKDKYEGKDESKRKLVPALDIEVIYLSHLVRTPQYRSYCEKKFGKVLDHQMVDLVNSMNVGLKEDLKWTEEVWFKEYQYSMNCVDDEKENGEIDVDLGFGVEEIILDRNWLLWLNETLGGLDVYNDRVLENAYKGYIKYLYLSAVYPCYVFNPTFEIDLFWHTHMLFPLQYDLDCVKYCGKVLHHEAWPKVDYGLFKRREDTIDLWNKEFNEKLVYRKDVDNNETIPPEYFEMKKMEIEGGIKIPACKEFGQCN